jgi:hypothetical protein
MNFQIYGGVGTPKLGKRKANDLSSPKRGDTLSSRTQRKLTDASKFLEMEKGFENMFKKRRPTEKLSPITPRKGGKTRRRNLPTKRSGISINCVRERTNFLLSR